MPGSRRKLIHDPDRLVEDLIDAMVPANPDLLQAEGSTGRAIVAVGGRRDGQVGIVAGGSAFRQDLCLAVPVYTGFAANRDDARVPAMMEAALNLVPDRVGDENQPEIKVLQVIRWALIKERTRLLYRLKTQSMALTKRQTKARIAQVKCQITELESALLSLLKDCPKRARA